MIFPYNEYPNLTLKQIKPDDQVSGMVEKLNFNFDQIVAFGGGPEGKKGDKGDQGYPGATTQGDKGDPGQRGSKIFVVATNLADGNLVPFASPHLEGDIVIDSDNDYFEVKKNPITGDLYYAFAFNINAVSLSTLFYRQDQYAGITVNPIVSYNIYNSDSDFNGVPQSTSLNKNDNTAVLAKRTSLPLLQDKAEFYRLIIGADTFPGIQNFSEAITNLIDEFSSPNAGDYDPTGSNFFAQLAFKYRDSVTSNVGARSSWINYKEFPTSSLASFANNGQAVIYLEHDFASSTNDKVSVKADVFRILKGTDNPTSFNGYLEMFQSSNTVSNIRPAQDLVIRSASNSASVKVTIDYSSVLFTSTQGAAIPTILADNGLTISITSGTTLTLLSNNTVANIGTLTLQEFTASAGINVNIVNPLVLQGNSGSGYADIRASFGLGNKVVTITAGTIPAQNADGSIIEVDVTTGNNLTVGISGGFDNQVLIITPKNGGLIIDKFSNIDLVDDTKLYLAEGEYLWVRRVTDGLGTTWKQFASSRASENKASFFASADISADFNNLIGPGLFKQIDTSITCANRSSIGHNDIITEVKIDPLSGALTQIQYNLLSNAAGTNVVPSGAMEVWERRRYWGWDSITATFQYLWGTWSRRAYTNVNQKWTALQENCYHPTILTMANIVGGKLILPRDGGNNFWIDISGAGAVLIHTIDGGNIAKGTEITISQVPTNFIIFGDSLEFKLGSTTGGGNRIFASAMYQTQQTTVSNAVTIGYSPIRLKKTNALTLVTPPFGFGYVDAWFITDDYATEQTLIAQSYGYGSGIDYGTVAISNVWHTAANSFVGTDPDTNDGNTGSPTMTYSMKRTGKFITLHFEITWSINLGAVTDIQVDLSSLFGTRLFARRTFGSAIISDGAAAGYNRIMASAKTVPNTSKLQFNLAYNRPDMVTAGGPAVPSLSTSPIKISGSIDLIMNTFF